LTPSETPLVTVVIVNFNGESLLDSCLNSVRRQDYHPLDVIVVDNGSADASVSMVQSKYPEVRVLPQGRNLGFAEGNNCGVREARGEYVVLLNNDTEVTPGWIAGLLDQFHDPRVAVVTSRVITDGVPEHFYTMNGSLNPLGYNIMRVFSELSLVFFAGGASLMFRKEEVPRPFLSEYFLYHEDVYLSWRMRLSGRSIRMAQSSVVHHRGSETTRKQSSAMVTFYQERNKLLNALLLFGMPTLLRLLPFFLLDGVGKLTGSLVLRRKSFRGIVKSYLWCLGNIPWIASQRRVHQKERRVPDSEVLRFMSGRLLDHHGSVAAIVNGMVRGYSRLVGLRFYD
jgi:hypothetical protein